MNKSEKSSAQIALQILSGIKSLTIRLEEEINTMMVPGFPDLDVDHLKMIGIMCRELGKNAARIPGIMKDYPKQRDS